MISSKKQKRFGQNQKQTDEVDNQQPHSSFFSKLAQRFPAKVGGAAISALIVLHFVSQFIFFQNDYVQDEIALPKTEREQIVEIKEIKSESEPAKSDVVTTAEPDSDTPTVIEPEAEENPQPKTVKKKQSRESKTERLRRAERILTGV